MTARTPTLRGYIVSADPCDERLRAQLIALAEQFPVHSRVVHVAGRGGTVALDQPAHVPGAFTGKSTAVCLGGEWHDTPMVFVTWDNEADLIWRAWVPAAKLHRRQGLAVNRPGNTARTNGGRR